MLVGKWRKLKHSLCVLTELLKYKNYNKPGNSIKYINVLFSLLEFLIWKTEHEMKHLCRYVLQSVPKVLPIEEKKYFYQCDHHLQMGEKEATSVVMETCPSVISVVDGADAFQVEFWDDHTKHSTVPGTPSLKFEIEAAIS